ncbi:hypothetical protein [Micromonospora sp. DT233]|uniref:hypothetical protein n=1 Tax=Micromonospora sp. DT233 TaxID=3393432 RepID=UPI003CEE57C3
MFTRTAATPADPGDKHPTPPEKPQASAFAAGLFIFALCGIPFGLGLAFADESGTDVPPPTAEERAQTVPLLAQAAAGQGICYGWRLERDFDSLVNVGSNFGDGVAVNSAGCTRWVQVRVVIDYGVESRDIASIAVTGSSGFRFAELRAIERGLERFGLDEDAFLDEPGWAICRAAATLPLLAAEAGLAPPAAPPSADPSASVAPLPGAGSDFWRDRWGWLLATAGVLLVAGLLIAVGLVQWRRQRATPAGRTQGAA